MFAIRIAHVGTMCDYRPIVEPMWTATNGTHSSLQQFSTWGLCVLPLKVPTWRPHEIHVCMPSVLPMLGLCVIDYLLWCQCGPALIETINSSGAFSHKIPMGDMCL